MTPREQEEYRALRRTIAERGTARVWIFLVSILGWGALAIATSTLSAPPVATLLPLLVLAGAFEAVFALHVGVERIGRYLQVFFDDQWEHMAMAFGRPRAAPAVDPLFAIPYVLATAFNLMPALIAAPTVPELTFVGGGHALFVLRLLVARAAARKQRAVDLARFEELKQQRT